MGDKKPIREYQMYDIQIHLHASMMGTSDAVPVVPRRMKSNSSNAPLENQLTV
jgi:hypothetical protein